MCERPREFRCHPTRVQRFGVRSNIFVSSTGKLKLSRRHDCSASGNSLLTNSNAMVFLLVRIIGLGVETAEQLVHEILSRKLRDRKAVARYSGLTGSPDESGARRREKGLSRSGNERVRKILIQLSWRMLRFQPNSGLVRWFKARTASSRRSRKPMIVAFARKLIIALWRYANTGLVPEGFQLAK